MFQEFKGEKNQSEEVSSTTDEKFPKLFEDKSETKTSKSDKISSKSELPKLYESKPE